jgi:hypothetical protein
MGYSTSNLKHSKKKKVEEVEDTVEEVHRTHKLLSQREKLSIIMYLIEKDYIDSDYEFVDRHGCTNAANELKMPRQSLYNIVNTYKELKQQPNAVLVQFPPNKKSTGRPTKINDQLKEQINEVNIEFVGRATNQQIHGGLE